MVADPGDTDFTNWHLRGGPGLKAKTYNVQCYQSPGSHRKNFMVVRPMLECRSIVTRLCRCAIISEIECVILAQRLGRILKVDPP